MKEKSRELKIIKICDLAFFTILLFAYTAVTFYLFYHQAIGNENWFHSDMKAYMLEMQGLDSGYDFPYPVFFKLGAFFHFFLPAEPAIAIALTILNSLSPVLLKYYLNRQLVEKDGRLAQGLIPVRGEQCAAEQILLRAAVSGLVFSLFLVSMLFPLSGGSFPGIQGRYKGVFSPNPYHNATYLAARPFAIVCFFRFAELLKDYEKSFSWKKGIVFSVFLLLATMTKPSFTFVLVGTAGVIMVYRLLKSGFRNFKESVCLGICFLPTFCDLLYQFMGVFGPREGEETGVGFGWLKAWSYHCDNVPLAIVLALGFPLVTALIHHKEIRKNTLYRFSLQLAAMSLFMAMLMYEKGFRLPDMNFSWGYMYGMFFAFTGAAVVMVRGTLKKDRKWYLLAAEWIMYLLHLGCGLLYFKNSLAGFMYY